MTLTRLPQRIVCLTSETVEVLYALGEQARIVGISGYTVHPPQARKEKPKVFAFTSGDLQRILAVAPDLVLTFSDLQAEIVGQLIRAGVAVHAFNQRRVDGILAMIETVGRLVGAETRALALVAELSALIDETRQAATTLAQRPRVYFEESLALARALGDRTGVGTVVGNLGALAMDTGDVATAHACFEEALAITRETDDLIGVNVWLLNLAFVAATEGATERALALYEEARQGVEAAGDRPTLGYILNGIGRVLLEAGRADEALGWLRDALAL
ncbi:MAG TPA: ABC transporter substrate-binding protein, partial [Accumulibacter sp.]|nr:ABC transporter substrate-binding protein [Accumulibacter sp.]